MKIDSSQVRDRIIAAIGAVVILMVIGIIALVIGSRGACEECGQVSWLRKFTMRDGSVRLYCDDCYRMAKLFLAP